jgi:hypothetical protein
VDLGSPKGRTSRDGGGAPKDVREPDSTVSKPSSETPRNRQHVTMHDLETVSSAKPKTAVGSVDASVSLYLEFRTLSAGLYPLRHCMRSFTESRFTSFVQSQTSASLEWSSTSFPQCHRLFLATGWKRSVSSRVQFFSYRWRFCARKSHTAATCF